MVPKGQAAVAVSSSRGTWDDKDLGQRPIKTSVRFTEICFFFFFPILGFELRASCIFSILGFELRTLRCSTT
jgi:hypothetical protein